MKDEVSATSIVSTSLQYEHYAPASSMEEERQSDYFRLIEALLACPNGEELKILHAHPNLLDDSLVTAMETAIEILEQQGNDNEANWLRNFSAQLANAIANSSSATPLNTFHEMSLKEMADRVLKQGIQQYQTSQFQAALQSWQESLKIYKEIGEHSGVAKSLNNLGLTHETLGQYQLAIAYHQQSLKIAQESSSYSGIARSLNNLGIVYNSLGQYQLAIEYHQQSLEIVQEIGDRSGIANSFRNLGITYDSLGQYQLAIDYHQQSLEIAKEIGDRSGIANSLNNLGNACDSLGQHQLAIDYYQQSLNINQALGTHSGVAICLNNLGNAYRCLGQYQLAITYCQHSLEIAKEIGDHPGVAASLGTLGIAYHSLGQYQLAIDYHQQSLNIKQEIGDSSGAAGSLGNLGIAYQALEQYQLAIDYHQQHRDLAQEIGDRLGVANSLNNLGAAYRSLGQYQLAIDCHQQHRDLAQEIDTHSGVAECLNNLGIAYDSLGQYQLAIDYYYQSLEIAKEIGEPLSVALSLNNLGAVLLKSSKLETAESTKYNQLTEAKKILHQAIEVWESLRVGLEDAHKVSIFEEQVRSYRLLQEALITQNQPREALAIAERGRARAFVELLNERLFEQSVEQAAITPLTIQQIQKIAQEQKSIIVEYSIFVSTNLLIWLIEPSGEIAFRQVDLKPLEELNTSLSDLVIQARESLEVPDQRRDAPRLLRQLHEILIQPIASLLPTDPNATVIFIPQGTLFLAPFPALQDANGKFLIEQHTIVTAPSIQVLDSTRKRQQHLKDEWASKKDEKNSDFYLVVGNPTMPSIAPEIGQPPEQLPPLEGAEEQARTIAKLLNTQPVIHHKATKVNVVQRMLNARLIHLATHGLLNDIRELGVPGAIALAPTEGVDNGFLTAGEILDLKLKAELVVLSACLTGLGKITGDGVIGLSRCLFLAGVPSVIVSLWSVPDKPTQYLMTEFYGNLQGGMNKAKALRQAILTTKQKFRSPVNWAGFTLIGESE